MKTTFLSCFSLIIIILVAASEVCAKEPVVVGFWEKDGIRKAFEFKEGRWQSSLLKLDNFDELKKAASQYAFPSQWTVFFDGKSYGNIVTNPFVAYESYKENGLQKIVSNEPQLKFRKTDRNFAGWSGVNIRPVLVSNLSDLTDPEKWKPTEPSKVDAFILKDLKERLKGKIYFCKNENCDAGTSTRDLKEAEIVSFKSYKNLAATRLQAIILKFAQGTFAHCEIVGDECKGEGPFWYFLRPTGEIKFLTKAASLIDTADLNKDGNSELLFWINEYNLNGYELIDGKSNEIQRAAWSFH